MIVLLVVVVVLFLFDGVLMLLCGLFVPVRILKQIVLLLPFHVGLIY